MIPAIIFMVWLTSSASVVNSLIPAGPLGKVHIISAKVCDGGDPINFNVTSGADGLTISGYIKVVLKKAVSNNDIVTVTYDKWEFGKWQKNAFRTDYVISKLVKKYKKTYLKIAKATTPNLPQNMPLPAKTYELYGTFKVKDIPLPTVPYGKYYTTAKVLGFCIEGEADLSKN